MSDVIAGNILTHLAKVYVQLRSFCADSLFVQGSFAVMLLDQDCNFVLGIASDAYMAQATIDEYGNAGAQAVVASVVYAFAPRSLPSTSSRI